MEEKKQIKVNLNPNLFAIDNVRMVATEEHFQILMISGNQGYQFLVTPKHAKRIYLLLGQLIDKYENDFGKLETQLLQKREETKAGSVGFKD